MKIFDFFFKKKVYRDEWFTIAKQLNMAIEPSYIETPFVHWLRVKIYEPVERFFYKVTTFNFKYDILYKKVYLKWFLNNPSFIAYDSWNLDYSMVDFLVPRILWLIKNKHGIPVGIIEECQENGIIKKQNTKGVHLSDEDESEVIKYMNDTLYEIAKNLVAFKRLSGKLDINCDDKFNNAMDLIKKYYPCLWD